MARIVRSMYDCQFTVVVYCRRSLMRAMNAARFHLHPSESTLVSFYIAPFLFTPLKSDEEIYSFIWKINGGKRALDVTNNFETEIFRGNINRSEEEDSSNHTGFHRWKPYKCDFTVHRQYVYRGI